MPTGTPVTGASNAGEVGRNRDSELTSGFSACCQRCNRHVLSTRSPVDHGHRSASCDTSLVVNSGVDCGRRQNFYDKKPQRYAKDNKTACTRVRNRAAVVAAIHTISHAWHGDESDGLALITE